MKKLKEKGCSLHIHTNLRRGRDEIVAKLRGRGAPLHKKWKPLPYGEHIVRTQHARLPTK